MSDVDGTPHGSNGSSLIKPRARQTSAATIIARCDRLALERLQALERAEEKSEARVSLAEEMVEDLADELAGLSSAGPKRRRAPTRTESIAAEWWRGRDTLASMLDNAGLDDAERDLLAIVIGLCQGQRCFAKRRTENGDARRPMSLMRLVDLGPYGPITREQLGPDGRLAKHELLRATWAAERPIDGEPHLALVSSSKIRDELADPEDNFGYPLPWLRSELPRETLDDVVVPAALRAEFDQLLGQCRHAMSGARGRGLVYGRGLVVLFHGPAGTGKTFAARALAGTLGVPLASYDRARAQALGIGDDHVQEVLEGWRPGDGVLFIDEVDDVLDDLRQGSNNELLIALESFQGVLLMATNRTLVVRDSLDRRIHRIVHFPAPDRECRGRIIRRMFAASATLSDDDVKHLARHPLSGGLIKNAWLEIEEQVAALGGPVTADAVDDALRLQDRRKGAVAHAGLLDAITAADVEGLEPALAVLQHSLDAEGRRLRAQLGLHEPVIDIVGPHDVALGLIEAIAAAVGIDTEHVIADEHGRGMSGVRRSSTRPDDESGEVAATAKAIVLGDEAANVSATAASAQAHAKGAFAAFRALEVDESDAADVVVHLDAESAKKLAVALIDVRLADARGNIDDARGAAIRAACRDDEGVGAAVRALGVAVAEAASGLDKSRTIRSARPSRGLFEH